MNPRSSLPRTRSTGSSPDQPYSFPCRAESDTDPIHSFACGTEGFSIRENPCHWCFSPSVVQKISLPSGFISDLRGVDR